MREEYIALRGLPAKTNWPDELARQSAPIGGWDLAVRTDRPFRQMEWWGIGEKHDRPVLAHRRIFVRIIDLAPGESQLEVWDYSIGNH